MEQMHGFGHGIAIVIVMAMLWCRQPVDSDVTRPRQWTDAFSVWFVLFVIGYLNLHKLVGTWIEKNAVPAALHAPFWESIELSALGWFRIVWWSAAAVCAWLMGVHLRRKLDLVPLTWTGKGQLIYVLFLWIMVIGNLQRAIPGFQDGRMVTEWILFMNACLATLLIGLLPQASRAASCWESRPAWSSLSRTWIVGLLAASALMCSFAYMTLKLYQPHLKGKPWANHHRFGPEAKWRVDPILKQGEHP